MIFTYWHGDNSLIAPMIADWSATICEPRIFSDPDAESALRGIDPEWVDIYRRINIPSCRSDIARLALLYRHGGLYVDAHSGRPSVKSLTELFATLAQIEFCVAVWRSAKTPDIPLHVANGAMMARRRSDVTVGVLSALMDNLRCQMAAQARGAGKTYNIAAITGGWAIRMHLFRRDTQDLIPHPHFKDRISTLPMDARPDVPFWFYVHYGYRTSNNHWSERQKMEPLFITEEMLALVGKSRADFATEEEFSEFVAQHGRNIHAIAGWHAATDSHSQHPEPAQSS